MKSTAFYTTSNLNLPPEIINSFISQNSGTIDSRLIVKTSLSNVFETNDAIKPSINYLIKSFLYPRQSTLTGQTFEETYYYQDKNIVSKILKLVENIGIVLFRKLDDKQKMLMARTAGILEFSNRININSVYSAIDTYEP
jgi:hypothetical protein